MFPHIQIFLWQMLRGKARLILNLALLLAATAFFVISLNLYQNSWANLRTVADTYTTIATMEIYGDVNAEGDLVRPGDEDRVGHFLLTRYGYDLSPLQELPMVQNIELRYRCAAYIPGQLTFDIYASEQFAEEQLGPNGYRAEDIRIGQNYHMFRFQLGGTEPVTIDLTKESKTYSNMVEAVLKIKVMDSAHPQIQYSDTIGLLLPLMTDAERDDHGTEVQRLNRTQDANILTLYPDVEYVMHSAFNYSSYYRRDPDTGLFSETNYIKMIDDVPVPMYFGLWESGCISLNKVLMYRKTGEFFSYVDPEEIPYFIQRWDDVQNNPEEATYFAALWQATEHSASSFAVTLTSDIAQVPAWHTGGMFLNEGRMITKEEYRTGAKVCMISASLAKKQGWQVGDMLDMHLYQYEYFKQCQGTEADTGIDRSMYTEGFFDEDQYEIVGIYSQREITDTGDTALEVFAQPWNAIYIPENSAPNAPALEDRPIQPSLITIELQNGSVDEFKAAVEEMGLTDQVPGEYEIKFSYFDQGYSKIAGGLQEMHRNAKILLGLSSALMLVTMVLVSFLFSRQHKHSAGILRMLGGSKGQAFAAILVCAAAVVAAGSIAGTILGGSLTQTVAASILSDVESTTVVLSTGANAGLTMLTGLGCMVMFLLLTAIFTATYIGKEPRALLPEDNR